MKTSTVGLTVEQAARKLKTSKTWVYSLIGKGRIRVVGRGQPRNSGRFAGPGLKLDAEDVEREAERRRAK